MDEQTGTEDVLFDPSDFDVQEAEQSEDTNSPAVEATNEEQTTSEDKASAESEVSTEKQEETQTGDAIDEFLAKKGVDPSDPQAVRKIAEMYQNVEKGFYQKSQEKAKLERELANSTQPLMTSDAGQQALQELRSYKTQLETERWKNEKQISPETEQKMIEWMSQPIIGQDGKPLLGYDGNPIVRGVQVVNGLITLDNVLAIVGGNTKPEIEEKRQNLTEELRNEVRKEMSARQAAKSTKQGSTDSMQFDKPAETDSFLEGLGF
jgi:hypothetical protein